MKRARWTCSVFYQRNEELSIPGHWTDLTKRLCDTGAGSVKRTQTDSVWCPVALERIHRTPVDIFNVLSACLCVSGEKRLWGWRSSFSTALDLAVSFDTMVYK